MTRPVFRLKKYPVSIFKEEIWKAIEFIFWRERVPGLPDGMTPDGMEPFGVETTKRGVEITGTIFFLPSGSYSVSVNFLKPDFSTSESVTVSKLKKAVIQDAHFDQRLLKITVTVLKD